MVSEDPIRGAVARVLSSRELVINRGAGDGVEVGMYFAVLDPKGSDILDPQTGALLGSVERPKVFVRIASVQEHLAVARTFRKRRVNVGGKGGDLSTLLFPAPPKWVDQYESLRTDESTWEDLDERDSYVKTGDPVRQVSADDIETM